jgi:hypothetical protein
MANKNEENDKLHRKGISVKCKADKINSQIGQALKDEAKKKELMDFIFGKSTENPLASIRSGIPAKVQEEPESEEPVEENS